MGKTIPTSFKRAALIFAYFVALLTIVAFTGCGGTIGTSEPEIAYTVPEPYLRVGELPSKTGTSDFPKMETDRHFVWYDNEEFLVVIGKNPDGSHLGLPSANQLFEGYNTVVDGCFIRLENGKLIIYTVDSLCGIYQDDPYAAGG